MAYFTYLACLGMLWRLSMGRVLVLASIPAVLWAVWHAQSRSNRRLVAILRDWWPLSLILAGYWAVGWFTSPPLENLQVILVELDRVILNDAHLRALIEAAGPWIPAVLETIYLLLYAIPPVCLGILYASGGRSQAPRFLLLVFAGTFSAYALLPWIPVRSPRLVFPGADLPGYSGTARSVNIWLLDHLDISTSVLPSGHVAVAFSSALAMIMVLPRRPWVGRCAFAVACLIYLATIYCRYHYSVDGLASIVVVSLISGFVSRSSCG